MTQKNVHLAKLLVLHETLLVFDAFHFKIAISKIFPHVSATLWHDWGHWLFLNEILKNSTFGEAFVASCRRWSLIFNNILLLVTANNAL